MTDNAEINTLINASLKAPTGVIREDHAKEILKAFHIPVVQEKSALTPEEAGSVANSMGFPVVLKACGEKILHKTESGLVRVGLSSEKGVTEAAASMAGTKEML